MRILHVIPALAPAYGGPSQVICSLLPALEARGVEAHVVATDAAGCGRRLDVALGQEVGYCGLRGIFFRRQLSEAFKYSRPLARWLRHNVGRYDLAHIHAVFSHSSVAAATSCRRAGVPYLIRPLGSLSPWSLRRRRLRKRLFMTLVMNRIIRSAAALTYTSEAERREVEETMALEGGFVVPLGVDRHLLDTAARGSSSGSRQRLQSVLSLGRLHPKKGLELLLEAFCRATEEPRLDCWRLVVAGEGEDGYTSRLKERFADPIQRGLICFTGWLSGEEKRQALSRSSLFALPSQHENFGVAVAEAMACGTPVAISPAVGLAPDVEEAGAGWVFPWNVERWVDGLRHALIDPGERQRRGMAGRRLVAGRFVWERVADRLLTLYHGVLGASS